MQKRKILASVCALLMACTPGITMLPVSAADEPAVSSSLQDYADAVVSLVNQERTAQGLQPLQSVPVLNDAAAVRSQELVTSFSHTRPDGRSCATVLSDLNISWNTTGENIAYGYSTPEAVMNGWMQSSGHKANILNADFDSIGVGVISRNGVLYWTQIFTGGGTYDDTNQPVLDSPDTIITVPDTKPETDSTPELPFGICINDDCFSCKGTDCTGLQDNLTELIRNCKDGNCNIQSVMQKFCP